MLFFHDFRKHRHKSRVLNPTNTNSEFIRSVSVPADRMISKGSAPFNPVTTPVTPDLEYVLTTNFHFHLFICILPVKTKRFFLTTCQLIFIIILIRFACFFFIVWNVGFEICGLCSFFSYYFSFLFYLLSLV